MYLFLLHRSTEFVYLYQSTWSHLKYLGVVFFFNRFLRIFCVDHHVICIVEAVLLLPFQYIQYFFSILILLCWLKFLALCWIKVERVEILFPNVREKVFSLLPLSMILGGIFCMCSLLRCKSSCWVIVFLGCFFFFFNRDWVLDFVTHYH